MSPDDDIFVCDDACCSHDPQWLLIWPSNASNMILIWQKLTILHITCIFSIQNKKTISTAHVILKRDVFVSFSSYVHVLVIVLWFYTFVQFCKLFLHSPCLFINITFSWHFVMYTCFDNTFVIFDFTILCNLVNFFLHSPCLFKNITFCDILSCFCYMHIFCNTFAIFDFTLLCNFVNKILHSPCLKKNVTFRHILFHFRHMHIFCNTFAIFHFCVIL